MKRSDTGGEVPTKLMEVDVRVITNQQCQAWFDESDHSKSIEKGFICAGFKEGVKDSCEVGTADSCALLTKRCVSNRHVPSYCEEWKAREPRSYCALICSRIGTNTR